MSDTYISRNGQVRRKTQTLTASGRVAATGGLLILSHPSVVVAATLPKAMPGDDLLIVNNSASGSVAHTVTCPPGTTFDGTNNTATLNAPGKALHLVALSAARWFILENIGTVTLSSV